MLATPSVVITVVGICLRRSKLAPSALVPPAFPVSPPDLGVLAETLPSPKRNTTVVRLFHKTFSNNWPWICTQNYVYFWEFILKLKFKTNLYSAIKSGDSEALKCTQSSNAIIGYANKKCYWYLWSAFILASQISSWRRIVCEKTAV